MLTNSSYRLLKKLMNNNLDPATLPQKYRCSYERDLDMLLENSYISQKITDYDFSSDLPTPVFSEYEITNTGIAYIQIMRKDLFTKWIPYSITAVISIAALIISVFFRD